MCGSGPEQDKRRKQESNETPGRIGIPVDWSVSFSLPWFYYDDTVLTSRSSRCIAGFLVTTSSIPKVRHVTSSRPPPARLYHVSARPRVPFVLMMTHRPQHAPCHNPHVITPIPPHTRTNTHKHTNGLVQTLRCVTRPPPFYKSHLPSPGLLVLLLLQSLLPSHPLTASSGAAS